MTMIACTRRRARRGFRDVESHTGTPKLMKTMDKMMSFATGSRNYRARAALGVDALQTPARSGKRSAMP